MYTSKQLLCSLRPSIERQTSVWRCLQIQASSSAPRCKPSMGADDKPEKREKGSKHSAEKHKDRSKDKDRGQKEHKSSKEHKEHKHKRQAEDEPRRDGARASDKRQKLPGEAPDAGAGRSRAAHSAERQANGAEAAPGAPKPAAGLEPEAGPAPGAVKAQVHDAGGEVSMSVEETNRCVICIKFSNIDDSVISPVCIRCLQLWSLASTAVCGKQNKRVAINLCVTGALLVQSTHIARLEAAGNW